MSRWHSFVRSFVCLVQVQSCDHGEPPGVMCYHKAFWKACVKLCSSSTFWILMPHSCLCTVRLVTHGSEYYFNGVEVHGWRICIPFCSVLSAVLVGCVLSLWVLCFVSLVVSSSGLRSCRYGWLPRLGFEEAFILPSVLKNSCARNGILAWHFVGVGLLDLGFLQLQKYLWLSCLFCEVFVVAAWAD